MRVLIATVTAGGGHLQAAAALVEAWRSVRPRDTLEKLDVLDYSPGLYQRIYKDGYATLAEHAPELYALVFKKTDNAALARKLSRLRRTFSRAIHRPFVTHLKEFRPDVVICVHYLPLEVVGGLKAHEPRFRTFTVCVVTDFEAHALWMEPCVDLYCVAAEETRASLVARGVAAQQVAVTGIPISPRFSLRVSARAVRKQCGLRDDLPVLLVLSGGFGLGHIADILVELDKLQSQVQVLVVAGRNEALRRELAGREHRHPTRVFGFVTNMQELMAASDLIVTKPGGLTTSEALAMGKPLFIVNPIPGQETANSDFLLEHSAAIKVNRVEDVAARLDRLVGSPRLLELSRNAKALGRPAAASTICEEVVRRLDG